MLYQMDDMPVIQGFRALVHVAVALVPGNAVGELVPGIEPHVAALQLARTGLRPLPGGARQAHSRRRPVERRETRSLASRAVEIVGRKPALESGLARRPFAVEHGVPGGVAAVALDDHVLAENALELEAEAQC